MFYNIVIIVILAVICECVECNQPCKQYINRQYTRVKRGKYYSNPPIRFYNQPPMAIPIKGPFSYTPPPFMANDEPPYPGSRPYKVSKRPNLPSNDGLGDDEITNLVKHLSKQDLDKILEFAQEKDQIYNKYNDVYTNSEYSKPFKRESKIVNKGNIQPYYEDNPYTEEHKFPNYVTEPTPTYAKVFAQENPRPNRYNRDRPSQRVPYETDNYQAQKIPNEEERYLSYQDSMTSQILKNYPSYNSGKETTQFQVFSAQEPSPTQQIETPNDVESLPINQNIAYSQGEISFSANPYYSESSEEDKLPRPVNMREEDYEASNTNNVQKIVTPEYNIENFGDLPLMDYNSKLHDVSSYHVPHYTVTQPKPVKLPVPPQISFSPPLSSSYSSPLLKPSPAAAAIQEPVYERAPSIAAAAEQSDAHLKATKIWSHKSKGAAYTLHDDGSLTPERSRPIYG